MRRRRRRRRRKRKRRRVSVHCLFLLYCLHHTPRTHTSLHVLLVRSCRMYRSSYTVKIPTRPFLPSIQPRAIQSTSWGCLSLIFLALLLLLVLVLMLVLLLVFLVSSHGFYKLQAQQGRSRRPVHSHPSLIPFPTQPTHGPGNPPVDSV
ncbi:hypothetical protein LZ30DRAFT_434234 [Colletotrichum cereale]|nr:hypothetical protein LZ30DRAFT_434234 [Colletotrichum cereale]